MGRTEKVRQSYPLLKRDYSGKIGAAGERGKGTAAPRIAKSEPTLIGSLVSFIDRPRADRRVCQPAGCALFGLGRACPVCLGACACMSVRGRTRASISVGLYLRVCLSVPLPGCVLACGTVCVSLPACVCVCAREYLPVCLCACVSVCVRVYVRGCVRKPAGARVCLCLLVCVFVCWGRGAFPSTQASTNHFPSLSTFVQFFSLFFLR